MLSALAINFLVTLYVYSKSDINALLGTASLVTTELLGNLSPEPADSVDSNTSNRT